MTPLRIRLFAVNLLATAIVASWLAVLALLWREDEDGLPVSQARADDAIDALLERVNCRADYASGRAN